MDACGIADPSAGGRGGAASSVAATAAAAVLSCRTARLPPVGIPGVLASGGTAVLLFWGASRGLFEEILPRSFFLTAVAFLFSFALTPYAACLARRYGILDVPDARKIHGCPTPLLGGVAVFLGFLISLGSAGVFSTLVAALLSAAFVLLLTGVIDDRREIPAAVKLCVQGLCTLLVMAAGIVLRVLPVGWGFWGEFGNGLLTVLWIVGLTNAFNFFDGMDGLAAGLGVLIAFFLAAAAFSGGRPDAGWMALALAGGCLGFLPYNFRPGKPAQIFLGDAGSTVIGFVLATLAVYGEWAESRPLVSLLCPILIFGVPIFDMVHITLDRILTGKVRSFRGWLEYVGRDHLHHRLADLLGSRCLAVTLIFLLSVCLGLNALVMREAAAVGVMLLCAQSVFFVTGVTILERLGRRTARRRCAGPLAVDETATPEPPTGEGVLSSARTEDAGMEPHQAILREKQKFRISSAP